MNCMATPSRKLPLYADAKEITVVAIVSGPARDLVLVGQRDLAAVDLVALPAVPEAAETLAEATGVARRVTGGQPQYLGVAISQGALDRLPNRIGNSRGLVEGDEQAPALVVQAGEGLGAAQAPRHGVDAPRPLMRGLDAGDGGHGDIEPIGADGEPQPFGELGPRLGLELRRRVGGNDPARVAEGGERPHDDPRHQRRLADAMARSDSDSDRVGGAAERPADRPKHVALPRLGTRVLRQNRPRLAPRKGEQYEAQWVVRIGPDLDGQRIEDGCLRETRGVRNIDHASGPDEPDSTFAMESSQAGDATAIARAQRKPLIHCARGWSGFPRPRRVGHGAVRRVVRADRPGRRDSPRLLPDRKTRPDKNATLPVEVRRGPTDPGPFPHI